MKLSSKKNKNKKPTSSSEIAFRLAKKKFNRFRRGLISLAILIFSLSISNAQLIAMHTERARILYDIAIDKGEISIPALTPPNVLMALQREGVKHPEIALRQAILETGWFECEHCSLSRNNIFGFYYKKKYLEFDNWLESVVYYKKWQDKRYSGGDYYAFLKKVGYATSPTYIQKLKSIVLNLND